jgi:hypothetical protein
MGRKGKLPSIRKGGIAAKQGDGRGIGGRQVFLYKPWALPEQRPAWLMLRDPAPAALKEKPAKQN